MADSKKKKIKKNKRSRVKKYDKKVQTEEAVGKRGNTEETKRGSRTCDKTHEDVPTKIKQETKVNSCKCRKTPNQQAL